MLERTDAITNKVLESDFRCNIPHCIILILYKLRFSTEIAPITYQDFALALQGKEAALRIV
jgi:hypothetical protein